MQLPPYLREAVAQALEGVSRNLLAERAARISDLYRSGSGSALAIRDDMDALAYAIARMPATFAAVRHALQRLEERSPAFAPLTVLDLGSGPSTAGWAVADAWPRIGTMTQVDSNVQLLRLGKSLSNSAPCAALRDALQLTRNLSSTLPADASADLVLMSYILAELDASNVDSLLRSIWQHCTGAIVLAEPGTPAGYQRILHARQILIAEGARILAPCPHEHPCPLPPGDWCHFVQRVERTRDHMLLKSAALPYEDERFSYLIAVREGLFHPAEQDRILARPEFSKAAIKVKLCNRDGNAELVSIVAKDRQAFKRAKKKIWGDEL